MSKSMIRKTGVAAAGIAVVIAVAVATRPEADARLQTPTDAERLSKTLGKVEQADEATFERRVLNSDTVVLVDFYADWCGPCRAMSPTLDDLAKECPDARIVKVNVDRNPRLAARYKVNSIPNLAVFEDGKLTARHVGVASKKRLKELLKGKPVRTVSLQRQR